VLGVAIGHPRRGPRASGPVDLRGSEVRRPRAMPPDDHEHRIVVGVQRQALEMRVRDGGKRMSSAGRGSVARGGVLRKPFLGRCRGVRTGSRRGIAGVFTSTPWTVSSAQCLSSGVAPQGPRRHSIGALRACQWSGVGPRV